MPTTPGWKRCHRDISSISMTQAELYTPLNQAQTEMPFKLSVRCLFLSDPTAITLDPPETPGPL